MNNTPNYAQDLPQNDADLFVLDAFPLLDKNEALKLGFTEVVWREILKMLTEADFAQDVAQMESAYAKKDWDKVQQLAHKIKGGAAYVGTVRMKIACQYLERYWKMGKRDLLEKLYQQAIGVIHETVAAVSEFLK